MATKQSSDVNAQTLDKSQLLHMYEQMKTIREFEERAGKEFASGKIPGFVHLYAGEEAVAVGVCSHLTDDDYITSHHRGHGHCIAKGVDLRTMVAELLGREAGACRGKGGSMNIADVNKGMLGANGIVGGGFPLAVGAGLTAKHNGKGQVAICFESTPVTYHMSCRDIADRAAGYNMPGVTVDGLDVFAVYEAADEAIARARRGEGPSLIECKTYRYFGHFEGDTITYRTKEEVDAFRSRDAIQATHNAIVKRGIATAEELGAIDKKVQDSIDLAWQFAESEPYPSPEEALTDVYVKYP